MQHLYFYIFLEPINIDQKLLNIIQKSMNLFWVAPYFCEQRSNQLIENMSHMSTCVKTSTSLSI